MSKIHSAATLKRQHLYDLIFRNTTWLFAFLVFAILAAIIGSLLIGSMPAIKTFGFGFLFSSEWNPVTEKFGALVPIIGTLVTSIIALSIGIPVSFGIALFLTEMSPPWLRRPLGTAIELLAGIPASFTACGACLYSPRCSPNTYSPCCGALLAISRLSTFCSRALSWASAY